MNKILSLLLLVSSVSFAYDQVLFVGAGGGLVYGINETSDEDRGFGGNFRVNAVYTNILGNWVSGELGFNYLWDDQDILSGYEMSGIQGDLRAKVYPLSFLGWNIAPYFAGGIGFLNYNSTLRYDDSGPVTGDEAVINSGLVLAPTQEAIDGREFTGVTSVFSWGAGITWVVNADFALEGSFNHSFTGTDEINPWIDKDGTNDAYYLVEVKLIYNMANVFGVSSGD